MIPLKVKSKFTAHNGWMFSCPYGGPTASKFNGTTSAIASNSTNSTNSSSSASATPVAYDATPVANASSAGQPYNSPAGLVTCDKFKSCSQSIKNQTGADVPGAECFKIGMNTPA